MGAPFPAATGERGAVVVEFALILPVLMMLLLGMVSGASAWNQSQSLGQGSRVAARYAATLPLPASDADMPAWLDSLIDRSVTASEGNMGSTVDGRAVCVAYVDPAGSAPDKTFSRRLDAAGVRTSGVDTCFDDGQSTTDRRIQVVLQRSGILDIGFHRQTLSLRRQVVYRYEAHSDI